MPFPILIRFIKTKLLNIKCSTLMLYICNVYICSYKKYILRDDCWTLVLSKNIKVGIFHYQWGHKSLIVRNTGTINCLLNVYIFSLLFTHDPITLHLNSA